MSSYDLLTPHWQVRFGVDLFLSKLTKLPPCKIVYIFLLDWAGSGCESEGCTAVFNTVWTVILRSFNSLAVCCMKRFIRGVDNAQLLSHTLWFRTERQAEEKEGRETDSEHKDKEMMITLLWLYEHTSWSQEFSHHGYLVLNASESNIIMFCLFYCVCRLFDRVIWTTTVYAETSRRCHTHSLACLSSSMHHHYQLLLLLFFNRRHGCQHNA